MDKQSFAINKDYLVGREVGSQVRVGKLLHLNYKSIKISGFIKKYLGIPKISCKSCFMDSRTAVEVWSLGTLTQEKKGPLILRKDSKG